MELAENGGKSTCYLFVKTMKDRGIERHKGKKSHGSPIKNQKKGED